jgi:hypothetical protein
MRESTCTIPSRARSLTSTQASRLRSRCLRCCLQCSCGFRGAWPPTVRPSQFPTRSMSPREAGSGAGRRRHSRAETRHPSRPHGWAGGAIGWRLMSEGWSDRPCCAPSRGTPTPCALTLILTSCAPHCPGLTHLKRRRHPGPQARPPAHRRRQTPTWTWTREQWRCSCCRRARLAPPTDLPPRPPRRPDPRPAPPPHLHPHPHPLRYRCGCGCGCGSGSGSATEVRMRAARPQASAPWRPPELFRLRRTRAGLRAPSSQTAALRPHGDPRRQMPRWGRGTEET